MGLTVNCNKIALGHRADDAMETLMLNMLPAGQMKGMPARYTSRRGWMQSMESDIATHYAALKEFPILPCNLCSNQANLQRPQVRKKLQDLNPNAKQNILRARSDIRPSHLLDQKLRESCGMDPITRDEDDTEEAAELW